MILYVIAIALSGGLEPPDQDTQRAAVPAVRVVRAPDGGIQPQLMADERGVVHLIYFKGDASAGDVFYCTSRDSCESFSAPIRVNSQSGSVLAIGSVRGAH